MNRLQSHCSAFAAARPPAHANARRPLSRQALECADTRMIPDELQPFRAQGRPSAGGLRACSRTGARAALLWTALGLLAGPPGFAASPEAGDSGARRLIRDLGDPDWRTREQAHRRLLELGAEAEPALRETLAGSDREAAGRAREILAVINPIQAAAVLIRVQLPAAGAAWRIAEKASFHGREGRIAAAGGGSYLVALDGDDPERARFSLRAAPPGASAPSALDLSGFEREAWCVADERVTTNLWQEGVHLEGTRRASMLLVWAAVTRLLDNDAGAPPLDAFRPGAAIEEALAESLLAQLAGHRSLAARLAAGGVLARLGEQRARRELERLAGEPEADAALARLGDEAAMERLARNLERGARLPEDEEAILALAARGRPAGWRVAAEHVLDFSERRREEAAWLLAERLLAAPAETPAGGAVEFLADRLRDDHMPWHAHARFLLYATARHPEGAARLLPLVREGLGGARTASTSVEQIRLHAIRMLLSRGAVPRDEYARLAAELAPHTRGSYWQEAVLALPYLCDEGTTENLRPFIAEARGVLADDKSAYYLKNLLWTLAILAPRGSPEAAELKEVLGAALLRKPPEPGGAAAAAAPRGQAYPAAVLEPLAFLLRVPLAADNAAGAAQLRAVLTGAPQPAGAAESDAPAEAYEFSFWTLVHRGDATAVRDARHFTLRMYETTRFRDAFGNLRAAALAPSPHAHYQKNAYVQLVTPGTARPVRAGEPFVTTVFPDSGARTVSGGVNDLYERYEQSPAFVRTFVCVRRGENARGPLAWEQALDGLAATMESDNHAAVQATVRLLAELKLKEAAPALRALLARRPSLDVAEALAALGDAAGEELLANAMRRGSRPEQIRAVTHFLARDAAHPEAVEALENLLRASTENDVYALMAPVRSAFGAGDPQRRRIIAALAARLTPANAPSLILLLREGTGLDFGYEEAFQSGLAPAEREARLARMVAAWKDALAPLPTDKRHPAPPPRE